MTELRRKENELRGFIRETGGLAIAFSGGTDSTLLAKLARDELGDLALAIHVKSVMSPVRETSFALCWAAEEGIRIRKLELDPLSVPEVRANTTERCYFCKREIMKNVKAAAAEFEIYKVADGTNTDDYGDFRPGMKATDEAGIIHPLAEAGFGKKEIRFLARKLDIPNWNLPSSACMASRIPYGTGLTEESMAMAERAEAWLSELGFRGSRVRVMDDSAVLELRKIYFHRFFELKDEVYVKLLGMGFRKVLLDTGGYRQGSLNPRDARK